MRPRRESESEAAMRSRRDAGSWLQATWEKPEAEGTGVEIWVRGLHFAGRRRICRPYGMIGVGVEAIEARSMTSDLTDWHQALARGSAAEEEARQSLKRGLPYQNRKPKAWRRALNPNPRH